MGWGGGEAVLCTAGRFGGERVVGLMGGGRGGQGRGLVLFLCWIRVDG